MVARKFSLFLAMAGVALASTESRSSDLGDLGLCRNAEGRLLPIRSLICESSPILIEASTPGLKIPSCAAQIVKPQVLPEHLPVSAVFVSCRPDNEESCANIAKEILAKKTGATVNVLINQDMLSDSLVARLKRLKEDALSKGTPLNVIPVSVPVGVYFRDPGVLAHSAQGTTVISNPHMNIGFLGEPVLSELAAACSYRYVRSAAGLAKFDAAYEMVINPSKGAPASRPRLKIKVPDNYESTGAELYGGNFMALPGGTLIVGETPDQTPNAEVLAYFEKRQRVMKIRLPPLAIGHVDEVFRIIPAKNNCGFSVLYASPAEMMNFLRTRPKDESVAATDDIMRSSWEKFPQEFQRMKALQEQVEAMRTKGAPIPPDLLKRFTQASEEFALLSDPNLTAGALLADEPRMKRWSKAETLIQKELSRIVAEIKRTSAASCEPQTVPLPMAWNDMNSAPLLPNPVNALTVNGTYFHSKPIRSLFGKAIAEPSAPMQSGRRERVDESYSAFEDYVHARLKPFFGSQLASVNTQRYDEGNGNFHCATLNVMLPCK